MECVPEEGGDVMEIRLVEEERAFQADKCSHSLHSLESAEGLRKKVRLAPPYISQKYFPFSSVKEPLVWQDSAYGREQ